MSNSYGEKSIRQLKGAMRVRRNPQNFLGSKGLDGAKHTLLEILGNATDEGLSGFGTKIDVEYLPDGSLSVRDYGRGVPLGYNENEKEWNYFLIYEELFAGGKYEDNQEILFGFEKRGDWENFHWRDYPYLCSIGMNGVGGACTQYTSEWFEVYSWYGGYEHFMRYDKGAHSLDELRVTPSNEPSGTLVKWKPDAEVFTDVNIPASWVKSLCKDLSMTTGFDIKYFNGKEETLFKGISIAERVKEDCGVCATNNLFYHTVVAINPNEDVSKEEVCVCEVDVAMGNGGGQPKFFNNKIEIRGGSHSLGLNTALFDFFKRIGLERGLRVKETDYSGRLSFIVTTLANSLSVRGQTKDSLDDLYICDAVTRCVSGLLEREKSKGTSWFIELIDEVMYACQLRVAQEELIKNHKELEKKINKHKVSDKFSPSESYLNGDVESSEIIIVEGDSAGGRAKTACDSRYQCILPIRGKSLNVYKATIEKLLENREIKDMIAALGCGIDLGVDGYESFDIKKLKVGNIYFLPDADIDGKHITMLLFLIFYKLFPELLYSGRVHIIDTPLYVVDLKSGDPIFCMTQEEMEQVRVEVGTNFSAVTRFKGLGEADEETLWRTSLNPETRHTRQLKLERGDTEVVDVLEMLFGKSTDRRRYAIFSRIMDDFDQVMEGRLSIDEFLESLNLNEGYLECEEVEVY